MNHGVNDYKNVSMPLIKLVFQWLRGSRCEKIKINPASMYSMVLIKLAKSQQVQRGSNYTANIKCVFYKALHVECHTHTHSDNL